MNNALLNKPSIITTLFSTGGLIIAFFMMCYLSNGFSWIYDIGYWFNISVGSIALLATAYNLGPKIASLIHKHHWNSLLTGITFGFLILWSGTFIGSLVGFFQEGLQYVGNNPWDPFFDYLFKPMYWVTLAGFIPVIVVGAIYGVVIKKMRLK